MKRGEACLFLELRIPPRKFIIDITGQILKA
jgi:hypothetical protein